MNSQEPVEEIRQEPIEEIRQEPKTPEENPNAARPVSTYDPYGTEDEKPVRTYGSHGNGSYQSRSSYSPDYIERRKAESRTEEPEEPAREENRSPENGENRYSNNGYGSGRTGYNGSYNADRFRTDVDPAPIEPGEARFRYRSDDGRQTPKKKNWEQSGPNTVKTLNHFWKAAVFKTILKYTQEKLSLTMTSISQIKNLCTIKTVSVVMISALRNLTISLKKFMPLTRNLLKNSLTLMSAI